MSEDVREELLKISLQAAPDTPNKKSFTFKCHGPDFEGNETLDVPVPVTLTIEQMPLKSAFDCNVKCQFITGGHAQRCYASHPENHNHNKQGNKVYCPYSVSMGSVTGTYKDPKPVHRDY
jgi:hypothetical protein